MIKNLLLASILAIITVCTSGQPETVKSLIPESNNFTTYDYFNTWNMQAYICSYSSNEDMRKAMNEENIFQDSLYRNWIGFYPEIRKDLIFVLDDSWDIPKDKNESKDNEYMGSLELDEERFPSFTGTVTERIKKLVDTVKANGWKGLGLWICAQEAPVYGQVDAVTYWIERLKVANDAGVSYWKVDWGKNGRNIAWRKMLTDLGEKYAPKLVIEHAMNEKCIEISDVYRTYDVENVIAQPVTIDRIAKLLHYKPSDGAKGIINCEDEPYIAAALGCAFGIQRHKYTGNLPNGETDVAFPAAGRNIKMRLDEVARGVGWHHIAEPFGVGDANYSIDTIKLKDRWIMGVRESWCTWCKGRQPGDTLSAKAPARVSRGLPLPEVQNPTPDQPFVLSSLYPDGAIAIATIGRGINRTYSIQRKNVTQAIYNLDFPIGIFGDYQSLTFKLPFSVEGKKYLVLGQDLAGDVPVNISKEISFKENEVIIPGDVIRKVGLSAATKGDLSDPGLVLRFRQITE